MNTNNFYDPFTHPENSTLLLLIEFMLMANSYGVNAKSLTHSLETFNSANCVNASFRDKINEEIAKTCCCQSDWLKRDISTMQMHQAQWDMIEDTVHYLHSTCAVKRDSIDASILQSSKTSFDPDSRILTIEHDAEGATFYVDNMPYETVDCTISKSSKASSSTSIVNLYANKVIFDGMLISDLPISLRTEVEQQLKELGFIQEIENYERNKAFTDAIEAVRDSFIERTSVDEEKAKPDDIYEGDGFIMRSLRKLVATANNVIGWVINELTCDFL